MTRPLSIACVFFWLLLVSACAEAPPAPGAFVGGGSQSAESGEEPGEEPGEEGFIGAACEGDADCTDAGAVCTEWPAGSGFCTILQCDQQAICPGGSECVRLTKGSWGCAPACQGSPDCRPGYPCKQVFALDSLIVQTCHAVNSNAGKVASLCEVSSECQSQMACIEAWNEGYCAVLGCSAAIPCPSKTSCVLQEEVGTACLKDCDPVNVCPGVPFDVQFCTATVDVFADPTDVCLPGSSPKPLGGFCTTDEGCLSGECNVTAVGLCSIAGEPCLHANDCPEGAFCDEETGFVQGTCAQSCSVESPCPEGHHCVPETPALGTCRPTCQGLADTFTCNASAGETCRAGIPLDEADVAYACVVVVEGQTGSACGSGGPACDGGALCLSGSSGGMCTASCGGQTPAGVGFCPWTTACASFAGASQCTRLCPQGSVECTGGFTCENFSFDVPFPLAVCTP